MGSSTNSRSRSKVLEGSVRLSGVAVRDSLDAVDGAVRTKSPLLLSPKVGFIVVIIDKTCIEQ